MSEREKKEYICLRCGNVYSSRAKEPQCPICRSRRRMELDKFLALPKEQQEKLLGKSRGKRQAENTGKYEEPTVNTAGNNVKVEEKTVKHEDSATGKYEEKGKQREGKSGEKVKGERVKKLSVPVPKLSWKAWSLVLGVVFIYYLYKVGWFDSILDHLKFMKASSEVGKGEKERPVVRSPVLGKIESNLRG